MTSHVLRKYNKFGTPYVWEQDADRKAHETELSLLTTQSTQDRSTSGDDGSQIPPSEHTDSSHAHRLGRGFSGGWRLAALYFAASASVVFFVNLSATIWISTTHKEIEDILSEGECEHIKDLNRGFHVLINVLSTILLSGSNYCMQCLSAPTRDDLDAAHAVGRWLEVGIPSIWNLRHIGRRRLYLWLLLGFSSLPLHLL